MTRAQLIEYVAAAIRKTSRRYGDDNWLVYARVAVDAVYDVASPIWNGEAVARDEADAARLLGPARMVLDRAAEGQATREECARMAQRIVDLIGHPATDEPPHAIVERDQLRAALAEIREWAYTVHGGVKAPIDIWPGLRAALDIAPSEQQ